MVWIIIRSEDMGMTRGSPILFSGLIKCRIFGKPRLNHHNWSQSESEPHEEERFCDPGRRSAAKKIKLLIKPQRGFFEGQELNTTAGERSYSGGLHFLDLMPFNLNRVLLN